MAVIWEDEGRTPSTQTRKDAEDIQDAMASWTRDMQAVENQKNFKKQRQVFEKVVEWCQWKTVDDLNADDMRRFLRHLHDEGKAPQTRKNHLGYSNSFAKWAMSTGRLEKHPFTGIKVRGETGVGARAITIEEVRRMIVAANAREQASNRPKAPTAAIYGFLFLTGFRRSTAVELRWRHVRLDARPPFIEAPSEIMKARRSHTVYLNDELASMLARMKRAMRPGSESDYVFPMWPDHNTHYIDQETAGIDREKGEGVSWHSYRHGHSTSLQLEPEKLRRLKEASEALGHSNIKITREIYTDPEIFSVPSNRLPSLGLDQLFREQGLKKGEGTIDVRENGAHTSSTSGVNGVVAFNSNSKDERPGDGADGRIPPFVDAESDPKGIRTPVVGPLNGSKGGNPRSHSRDSRSQSSLPTASYAPPVVGNSSLASGSSPDVGVLIVARDALRLAANTIDQLIGAQACETVTDRDVRSSEVGRDAHH